MGFINDISRKVKGYFAKDKEHAVQQLAKGATSAVAPMGTGDMLTVFGYDAVAEYLRIEHDLLARYVDYEEMDDYPEISTAIDIFADDATQPDTQINRSLWVTAKDRKIQNILDDLLRKQLRSDEEAQEIARTTVKYGNDFEEMVVTRDGVIGLTHLPPCTIRRMEGRRGELYGFIQDFKMKFNTSTDDFRQLLATRISGNLRDSSDADQVTVLEDWEVVHFRLRGKQRRSIYGHSVLEPARWIWKRLNILEDSAIYYRLVRSPERYVYYVNTGNLPPAEAFAYTNKLRQQIRKKKFINPSTGKLDLKFETLAIDDDLFIPSPQGQDSTRVEVLGSPTWQHMDDIEYFRDKLFAAIKIPKAYLAQDQNTARAVLSSEDVRFARSVLRIQRELRSGYSKIARVHLAALGIDPYAVDYDINMTVPSSVFELAQLEVRNARADLAGRMRDFVSLHWILSKIFGLADKEIEEVVKERGDDMKRDTMAQAEAETTAQDEYGFSPQMGPALPPPELPPAEMGPEQPTQAARAMQPAESRRNQWRAELAERQRENARTNSRNRRVRGIQEQELFRGSREAEKRAEGKLDQLLVNDTRFARRVDELQTLLTEMRQAGALGHPRKKAG